MVCVEKAFATGAPPSNDPAVRPPASPSNSDSSQGSGSKNTAGKKKDIDDPTKKIDFFKQLKKDWKEKKYTSMNMLMSIFGSLLTLALLIGGGFYAKHLASVQSMADEEGSGSMNWTSPKLICCYV